MNDMKESEIPFTGKIPKNWKTTKNKHCFKLEKNIVGDESQNTRLLSLTKKGIVEKDINASGGKVPESYDTYQKVRKGQIVLCLFDLDCSAVFSDVSKYDGMISPAYKVYNCNKNINERYAKYWFDFCFDGRKYMTFSKSLRYVVNTEDFGEIGMLVPPMENQEKIVAFLDSQIFEIEKVINETKETIENYKKYKQNIIIETVTKGLNKNIKYKDTNIKNIGKIPEDWKLIKNKYLYKIIGGNGFNENLQGRKTGNVPFYKNSDINGNSIFVTEAQNYIEMEEVEKYKFNLIPKNSILYGKIGEALKKNHRKLNKFECCIDNNVQASVLINSNEYDIKYGYYYFISIDMADFDNGGTIPTINNYNLKNTYFVVPPIIEQKKIANYLDNKFTEINNIILKKEKLIEELEQYKKSLIYEYVTGKKEVM